MGRGYSEGYELVQFGNLPHLQLGRFYLSEYLIKQSNRSSLLDLLIHLCLYKYVNKKTNIASGQEEINPDSLFQLPRSAEIDLFLKFDHVNMQVLGQARQRAVKQLDQLIENI